MEFSPHNPAVRSVIAGLIRFPGAEKTCSNFVSIFEAFSGTFSDSLIISSITRFKSSSIGSYIFSWIDLSDISISLNDRFLLLLCFHQVS